MEFSMAAHKEDGVDCTTLPSAMPMVPTFRCKSFPDQAHDLPDPIPDPLGHCWAPVMVMALA